MLSSLHFVSLSFSRFYQLILCFSDLFEDLGAESSFVPRIAAVCRLSSVIVGRVPEKADVVLPVATGIRLFFQ
ncbi:hypothetical protein FCM35_KLT07405 [Carex littledalei]|uniref:Uncharacterized protein n=1 Tax=Carex littledalei TaxID=544730 RepID=A0A833QWL9_9POAL|nr:hypothetical protein FCM35_KLT07405 [Carex littledalei]